MEIGVITNPNSRKNKNRPDRAAALQSIVGDLGEVHATKNVDSIKPILRDFLRRRARYWVADGGDGALHWMVRAGLEVLEEDEFKGGDFALPLTVPTNGGTIDFVAHNVGIRGDAEVILGALRDSIKAGQTIEEVEVDSMLMEGIEVTEDGDVPFRTFGFASAAGGIGQRFYDKYYDHADPSAKTIRQGCRSGDRIDSVCLLPTRTSSRPNQARRLRAPYLRPNSMHGDHRRNEDSG